MYYNYMMVLSRNRIHICIEVPEIFNITYGSTQYTFCMLQIAASKRFASENNEYEVCWCVKKSQRTQRRSNLDTLDFIVKEEYGVCGVDKASASCSKSDNADIDPTRQAQTLSRFGAISTSCERTTPPMAFRNITVKTNVIVKLSGN
jgi:hypothetical protein